MHVREAGGRTLHFGHSGWLWNSAYLLYDTETDSLWHHQTGWAMSGPLRGTALPRFPSQLTTFAAWTAEHPDTLVLPKPPRGRAEFARDAFADRNAPLSFGLGVDLPGAFRLYPFELLDREGLVSETVAGVPLVVARDRDGATAVAYDRRVDGSVIEPELRASEDGPLLADPATGRTWRLRSGRPVAGTASALRRLDACHWEAFAWELQHPTGTRFPAPSEDGAVPEGGR